MKKRVLICMLALGIACLVGCGSSDSTVDVNVEETTSEETEELSTEDVSKKIEDSNLDMDSGLLQDKVNESDNTEAAE